MTRVAATGYRGRVINSYGTPRMRDSWDDWQVKVGRVDRDELRTILMTREVSRVNGRQKTPAEAAPTLDPTTPTDPYPDTDELESGPEATTQKPATQLQSTPQGTSQEPTEPGNPEDNPYAAATETPAPMSEIAALHAAVRRLASVVEELKIDVNPRASGKQRRQYATEDQRQTSEDERGREEEWAAQQETLPARPQLMMTKRVGPRQSTSVTRAQSKFQRSPTKNQAERRKQSLAVAVRSLVGLNQAESSLVRGTTIVRSDHDAMSTDQRGTERVPGKPVHESSSHWREERMIMKNDRQSNADDHEARDFGTDNEQSNLQTTSPRTMTRVTKRVGEITKPVTKDVMLTTIQEIVPVEVTVLTMTVAMKRVTVRADDPGGTDTIAEVMPKPTPDAGELQDE
ncbi:hypothetical protein L915_14374 [Phytophthora nicotianae]|uniref:Uncharacterized protein n=1 Tax=Phytophthora nicotianae TaxID=4792 RepID=W2G9V0_PHYNI|nr:hypothetical protein L915_14374 [Phytophthora nicotianae]